MQFYVVFVATGFLGQRTSCPPGTDVLSFSTCLPLKEVFDSEGGPCFLPPLCLESQPPFCGLLRGPT